MNIDNLAVRAETVGRIDITAMLLVEVKPPVVIICIPERLEIVDIGTLGVENLAEKTLLGHIEASELKEVIDAVLKHHAMLPGAL